MEGYYRVKACLENGIARCKAFAPYCDLVRRTLNPSPFTPNPTP